MKTKHLQYEKIKIGSTVATTPFILIISMVFLTVLTVNIVNIILPFIWYQKMQLIATKYMYVIEKYGYLTTVEKELLYQEFLEEGFDVQKIRISFPKEKLEYGTLFKFEIEYEYTQYFITIKGQETHEARKIMLHVKKYSYSKI